MTIQIPKGFQLAGVHCGIKRDRNNLDITLVTCPDGAVAAGVYTKNVVCAAPVILDRQRTPSSDIRAVVINSGNANACTGRRGLDDAQKMAELTGDACHSPGDKVLVMSTGIIGEHLPMEKIASGIIQAHSRLADDDNALMNAALGMLTTDRSPKLSSRVATIDGSELCLTGMAKGAGMIGPNMATMLAVLMTDACLTPDDAQRLLTDATNLSFNCVSVEGHMSTNDTSLFLASAASSDTPLAGDDLTTFAELLRDVCIDLAREIADDGEGATHLVEIDVTGCASTEDAHSIARTIANSPLVKTACTGADPNWGRIVSAAGYAGPQFNPAGVSLSINGTLLYENGVPVVFDAAAVSASMKGNRETKIGLRLSEGSQSARFWTSDLTVEYIHINADYHT
jgi:glutamate N-acetyltransferase/amino-acid N-acetyltransferase